MPISAATTLTTTAAAAATTTTTLTTMARTTTPTATREGRLDCDWQARKGSDVDLRSIQ